MDLGTELQKNFSVKMMHSKSKQISSPIHEIRLCNSLLKVVDKSKLQN